MLTDTVIEGPYLEARRKIRKYFPLNISKGQFFHTSCSNIVRALCFLLCFHLKKLPVLPRHCILHESQSFNSCVRECIFLIGFIDLSFWFYHAIIQYISSFLILLMLCRLTMVTAWKHFFLTWQNQWSVSIGVCWHDFSLGSLDN